MAQQCYPNKRKCGSWDLGTSSCRRTEGDTAVLPGAVSLVKEKHPANSIKNVSQNAGEGSVRSAACPATPVSRRQTLRPSSARTRRGPSLKSGGLCSRLIPTVLSHLKPRAGGRSLGEAQGLAGCDPGCEDRRLCGELCGVKGQTCFQSPYQERKGSGQPWRSGWGVMAGPGLGPGDGEGPCWAGERKGGGQREGQGGTSYTTLPQGE